MRVICGGGSQIKSSARSLFYVLYEFVELHTFLDQIDVFLAP